MARGEVSAARTISSAVPRLRVLVTVVRTNGSVSERVVVEGSGQSVMYLR